MLFLIFFQKNEVIRWVLDWQGICMCIILYKVLNLELSQSFTLRLHDTCWLCRMPKVCQSWIPEDEMKGGGIHAEYSFFEHQKEEDLGVVSGGNKVDEGSGNGHVPLESLQSGCWVITYILETYDSYWKSDELMISLLTFNKYHHGPQANSWKACKSIIAMKKLCRYLKSLAKKSPSFQGVAW